MSFKKVNNITGWVIFLIAMATYFLTREARGSLWDTGEFIASADKVMLPHPPGAPLFVLLGRFFIILFVLQKRVLETIKLSHLIRNSKYWLERGKQKRIKFIIESINWKM